MKKTFALSSLRTCIFRLVQTGDLNALSAKRVRRLVEQELGLEGMALDHVGSIGSTFKNNHSCSLCRNRTRR